MIQATLCDHVILHVQWGESPLYTASFYGHLKCVQLLLEAGANVDVPKEVSVVRIKRPSSHQTPTVYI